MFSAYKQPPPKTLAGEMKTEAYLVIFDKSGRSLSGWHYRKLKRIGAKRIQQSAMVVESRAKAEELLRNLRKFGVQKVDIFRVTRP